jgi:hypothetical protein
VRQGNAIDQKAPDSLSSRVHACWINPALPPSAAANIPAEKAAPPASSGAGK